MSTSDMNDENYLLAETVNQLFGDLAANGLDSDDAARFARGELPVNAWQLIEENGIAALLLPEGAGGFGGDWQSAFLVANAAGYHTLPLPITETILAQHLLSEAGIDVPAGALTFACCDQLQLAANTTSGSASAVIWGGAVDHIVLTRAAGESTQLVLIARKDIAKISPAKNLVGEPVADLQWSNATAIASGTVAADVFALGALLRSAQIAGALNAALAQSVAHANERKQFGKPLGQFQAIQQALAIFADEAAAINCAALSACRAVDLGDGGFEIAAAKLRANRAVGVATSTAHQVHGAIGFTREHNLHKSTQRLWQWRSEFGNDRHWADVLGAKVVQRGIANFWSDLTERSDRL